MSKTTIKRLNISKFRPIDVSQKKNASLLICILDFPRQCRFRIFSFTLSLVAVQNIDITHQRDSLSFVKNPTMLGLVPSLAHGYYQTWMLSPSALSELPIKMLERDVCLSKIWTVFLSPGKEIWVLQRSRTNRIHDTWWIDR